MSIDTSDLLDLLESDEKPFASVEETKPTQSNYSSSSSNESSYKKDNYKKNKVDLWGDPNIEPVKLDRSILSSIGKYFAIVQYKGKEGVPNDVLEKMLSASKVFMKSGFVLRFNGETEGFNTKILDIDIARVETYLPWKTFNKDNISLTPKMVRPNEEAYHVAAYYHKKFKELPNSARAILARDVHVLLGENVKNPIKLLLCYSSDGAESIKEINFKVTGYISFSIMICDAMGIPVFNMGKKDALSRLVEFVKTLD